MKFFKKILCGTVAMLLLCGMLASCKGDAPSETESDVEQSASGGSEVIETKPVETDKWGQEIYSDPIPEEVDYKGRVVTMYMRNSDRYFREFGREERVSALDTQIYTRNMKVQTDLGVTFKIELGPDLVGGGQNLVNFNSDIQNSILANDGSIDIVAHYALYGASASTRALLTDLHGEEFTYLNLDRRYWNQNHQKAATTSAGLYYGLGDANLSLYDRLLVLHYNESMAEEYGIPDLYQMVLDGEWTYEALLKVIRDFCSYEDLDKSGTRTADDLYGIVSCIWSEAQDGFLSAWELPMIIENEGVYTWNVDGNEKFNAAAEKLKELFHLPTGYLCTNTDVSANKFVDGTTLLSLDILYRNDARQEAFENMDDDRGLLPLPKYDDDQQEYHSGTQSAYNIMCVPNASAINREMVSAVLEDLNYESYNSVRPYYFQFICRTRYVENSISVRMFNLILDSVDFDVMTVFNDHLHEPIWMFRYAICEPDDVALGGKATTMERAWAEGADSYNQALLEFQLWADGD